MRIADEEREKDEAESKAAWWRDWEFKQRLRDQIVKLQVQLRELEGHTGVRRRVVNRADWPAWYPTSGLPCCDCAQDCVGECIAKYLDKGLPRLETF